MRKQKSVQRIISALLSFVIILQGGFVMPAFADGTHFNYIFYYKEINDDNPDYFPRVTEDYPIVINSGNEPHYVSMDEEGTTTGSTLTFPEEPNRIVGYTFEGWWLNGGSGSLQIDESTVITDEIYDAYKTNILLPVYGQWAKYQSADINSNSVSFKAKNENGEFLPDNIELMQKADHSQKGFDKDVTDYDLYVYGDTSAVSLTFDQYEPKGSSVVTLNDESEEKAYTSVTDLKASEDGYTTGYFVGEDTTITIDPDVVTGKRYVTEYFDIGEKNTYTNVKVTVTLPDANNTDEDDENVENTGVSKTYTFTIHRFGRELKANYGNTPYGEISKSSTGDMTAEKQSFDNTNRYRNVLYSPVAWQWKGGNAENEKKKGYPLTDDADDLNYYNFDKDDTAIVVYSGQKFTDPGVIVYDDYGNEVALSSHNVKRTIKYRYVSSLKYSSWDEGTEETIETTLNNTANENIIDLVEHNGAYEKDNKFVRPGVYSIEYSYSPESIGEKPSEYSNVILRDQTVTRYFIVLPQYGDLNMDTYQSALDFLAYNNVPSDSNHREWDYIYKYRSLDMNRNGAVDDYDKDELESSTLRQLYYSSISIEPDNVAEPVKYTPSTSDTDGKAQLYMDFLGTDENAVAGYKKAGDYTQSTEQLNTTTSPSFYIGYRFANLDRVGLDGKKINSITLSVDYDKRYVEPMMTNMTYLARWIQANNTNLADVTINTDKKIDAQYTFDKSTASIYPWSSKTDTKTLTVEIFPTSNMTLNNGDYVLKLPFMVRNVPYRDSENNLPTVISARLDAKGFNMNIDGSDYMWDMSKTPNSVTKDMYDEIIEYRGDCPLPFGESAEPKVITPAAVYGTSWTYSELEKNSTAIGNIPPGLTYNESGVLTGVPTQAGTFIFQIGGQQYSLTVEKAPMRLIPDDSTKIYGEANPEFTFTMDETCFRNAEAADTTEGKNLRDALYNEAKGLVHLTSDAEVKSVVGDYEIYFTEESAQDRTELDNYYFTYDRSTLTVNKRHIKITGVTIPKNSIYSFKEEETTSYVEGETSSDSDDFSSVHVKESTGAEDTGVDGVLNGDTITVTYNVGYTYTNDEDNVGENKNVTVVGSSFIIKDTGDGNNYVIDSSQEDFPSNKGVITKAQITGFTLNKGIKLDYTYGERLDLNDTSITVNYSDNIRSAKVSFREAATDLGFRIVFYNQVTGEELEELTGSYLNANQAEYGYPLKVNDTGLCILIYIPGPDANKKGFFLQSNSITVSPMELTLKPDDKTRYYGFSNDGANVYNSDRTESGYSYKLVGGTIIEASGYGDTQDGIITPGNIQYTTSAAEASDIGDYTLEMTAVPSSNNYTFKYETGTLTITKRPITITGVSNIPALKSKDYMNSDDTYKEAPYSVGTVTAVAGGGETETLTVDGSVNGGLFKNDSGVADPIRVVYDVQYTHHNVTETGQYTSVNIVGLKLDDDYDDDTNGENYYAKNNNYILTDDCVTSENKGFVYRRYIKEISVEKEMRTSYTYGDSFSLTESKADNSENNVIHVKYDNDYEENLTVKEAIAKTEDWSVTYTKDGNPYTLGKSDGVGNEEGSILQVADDGAVITLTVKDSIYKTSENEADFTYSAELEVEPAELTVQVDTFYTIYGDAIPDFTDEDTITITGYKYDEDDTVLTAKPTVTTYEDDGTTVLNPGASVGTPAGRYILHADNAAADNYKFNYLDGALIVRARPLVIDKIIIPSLTSKNAFEAASRGEKYSTQLTTSTEDVSEDGTPIITFKSGSGLLDWSDGSGGTVTDKVQISYTITYEEMPLEGTAPGKTVPVSVTDAKVFVSDEDDESYRNYYIQNENSKQEATVDKAYIEQISIANDPTLERDSESNLVPRKYSYGDYLGPGAINVKYDSGRTINYIPFKSINQYDITAVNPYTNEEIGEDDWDSIFLKMGSGKRITFKPAEDSLERFPASPASTEEIIVEKRKVHIKVNNAEYTYGDRNYVQGTKYSDLPVAGKYSYHFDMEDFAPGEDTLEKALNVTEDNLGYTAPSLRCVINEEGDYPDEKTDAGAYDITVSRVGTSDNYEFVFDEEDKGTLTVNKRNIVIESINSIPMLTTEQVRTNTLNPQPALRVTDGFAANKSAGDNTNLMTVQTGVAGQGIANDDLIGITFEALYDTDKISSYIAEADYTKYMDVSIDADTIELVSGIVSDADYSQSKNYNLIEPLPLTSSFGRIQKPEIESITIEEEPDKLEYDYGEEFILSGGRVKISYSGTGDYSEYANFAQLGDYGIKVTYEGTDNEVKSGELVNAITHDGKKLVITLTENPDKNDITEGSVTVHPHNVRVYINPQSYTYGDTPPELNVGSAVPDKDGISTANYYYESGDLINGDSFLDDNFKHGLSYAVPELVSEATDTSDVGVYDIIGRDKVLDDAVKTNYAFTYIKGEMTVNKRTVKIISIDSGIPVLTSKLIHDDSRTNHSIASYAATDDSTHKMTVSNPIKKNGVSFDDIKITYNAEYRSTSPSESETVYIEYTGIDSSDEKYKLGANYELDPDSVKTATGEIKDKEIDGIRILRQPTLEYIYGEPLNLNSGIVEITYDDGSVEECTFADLPSDKTLLSYNDGADVQNGDVLYVKYHTGNTITIKVINPYKEVSSATTDPLKVYKKKLNIDADDVTVTYGDKIVFTWHYRDTDFANGDTETSRRFTRGLTAPTISCVDLDNIPVDETTSVGVYQITLSGGSAENYEFVYNNAILTINRRLIDILSIDSGIPWLTAKFIHQNTGPTYRLESSAVNTDNQMTVGNLANGDSIKVTYTAVYTEGAASDKVTVNLDKVKLDESYGKSSNYILAYVTPVSKSGRIIAPNIESIMIKTLPKMTYEFGDELDISNGVLRITYDNSDYVDVSFNELSHVNNKYNISFRYKNKKTYVANSDVMDLSYNEEKFEFTVNSSIYEVSTLTSNAQVTVTKRILYYGVCTVDPITYDGENTLTTGSISFRNPAGEDEPTAEGVFTFSDKNAGNNILVNITDVKLDDIWTDNYELSADYTTAYGTIYKASNEVPEGEIEYEFARDTNILTLTPLVLDEQHIRGGAKYEYSIDGGVTWQDSTIFEDIEIGQICSITARYADTANYLASDIRTPFAAQAHTAKITLISRDGIESEEEGGETTYETLASFYTSVKGVETEEELRDIIGEIKGVDEEGEEITVNYYTLTTDLEGQEALEYPLTLSGDMMIYATLIAPRRRGGGGGGGGGGGEKPVATKTPEASASPESTAAPSASSAPAPAATDAPYNGGVRRNTPYMSGFEDLIKPDDYMTRAEAATILVRLAGDTGEEYENTFPDVMEGTWYIDIIAQAAARGFISGFEDGNFYPEDTVTREQFTSMLVRMTDLDPIPGQSFADVEAWRWSTGSINAAVEAGIVTGYADGTFRPENPIRRSEAVRMANAATGRIPDKELIDTIPCPYKDLPKDHWAYYEIMIASCSFEY